MKARVRVTMMVGLASIVFFVASAAAQETRVDVIRQQQADRQQQLEPPQPTTFEKVIARLERLADGTGSSCAYSGQMLDHYGPNETLWRSVAANTAGKFH
jgi:hypothetical protein